jgi:hypothetical protein
VEKLKLGTVKKEDHAVKELERCKLKLITSRIVVMYLVIML